MEKNDVEKRELFYKMKRWKLASIIVPVLIFVLALLFVIFAPDDFIIQIILLPIFSIIGFVSYRKKASKLQEDLNDKGGLNPEEIEEYTKIFNKAWTKQFIIWGIILLAGLLIIFGPQNGSSKKSKNNQSEKNGFIGSDGKYHEYIPEFGDDVNNWMEENW